MHRPLSGRNSHRVHTRAPAGLRDAGPGASRWFATGKGCADHRRHTRLVNPRTPLTKGEVLGSLVILAILGGLVFLGVQPFSGINAIQCDGSVPTWMITEENEGTGCVEILPGPPPPGWDGSWICIGGCTEPNPSPFIPTPEP